MKSRHGNKPDDPGRSGVTLSREYDFPRETVFAMCTDPRKAARWFLSPEGGVTVLFELDARPGGTVRIDGHHGDGRLFKTSGTFLEIDRPNRVVLRTATTPPGDPAPFEALQTLVFEEINPRRTRVTVHVKVLSSGSFPGGLESLERGFEGGWDGTLNLLQRELAATPPNRASGAG